MGSFQPVERVRLQGGRFDPTWFALPTGNWRWGDIMQVMLEAVARIRLGTARMRYRWN